MTPSEQEGDVYPGDPRDSEPNVFYLLERGQAQGQSPPLWWAGDELWVDDVNRVPAEYRFETHHHAHAAIIIHREDYGSWPWACQVTEHLMV
jgi:hypothetical protein